MTAIEILTTNHNIHVSRLDGELRVQREHFDRLSAEEQEVLVDVLDVVSDEWHIPYMSESSGFARIVDQTTIDAYNEWIDG